MRAQAADTIVRAEREGLSYAGFLAELLMAECEDCDRRRAERRIRAAHFPREKSLRDFDYRANPNVDPAVIHSLAACDWIANEAFTGWIKTITDPRLCAAVVDRSTPLSSRPAPSPTAWPAPGRTKPDGTK